MDRRRGDLVELSKALQRVLSGESDEEEMIPLEHGEIICIKGGYFEVTKIDLRKQRIVLKPLTSEYAEQELRRRER